MELWDLQAAAEMKRGEGKEAGRDGKEAETGGERRREEKKGGGGVQPWGGSLLFM